VISGLHLALCGGVSAKHGLSAGLHRKASTVKRRHRGKARAGSKAVKTERAKRWRPTVLVADDDLDARTMYGLYFKSMGCSVCTATDGAGAFNQATELHPDIIVLDLAMPHVDGWAAAERLRRSRVTRDIPIIALTAVPGARESAHLSGCDAFVSKPCLPQLLWCEVRLLLGLEETPGTIPA
jgi:two-component system cell cycle response regulator DivK